MSMIKWSNDSVDTFEFSLIMGMICYAFDTQII